MQVQDSEGRLKGLAEDSNGVDEGDYIPGINTLSGARNSSDEDKRVGQCRAGLTEVRGAAALDAALSWCGMKMGTTNAVRIIKTAKPTRMSTKVTCHFRLGFFIRDFLSLSYRVRAIQFPDCGEMSPF